MLKRTVEAQKPLFRLPRDGDFHGEVAVMEFGLYIAVTEREQPSHI